MSIIEIKDIKDFLIKTVSSLQDTEVVQKATAEIDVFEKTFNVKGENQLDKMYKLYLSRSKRGLVSDVNKLNSWLAYALGITSKKPDSDSKLLFRRVFARPGFPDIDSDFDYDHRDRVYEYIIDKYGRENVGNIGAYGTLKLKSAIRKIGKSFDVAGSFLKGKQAYVTDNDAKVSEIVDTLPKSAIMKAVNKSGEQIVIKTVDEACECCNDFRYYMDKFPGVYEHVKNLTGLITSFGIHASGIVLSDVPLELIAPLKRAKDKGQRVVYGTQYDGPDLDTIGLIKFDILAISTLTVIQKCIDLIEKNYGYKIDVENLNINDEKTFALYRSGHLTGVFQCESRGMQETMVEMGVENLKDIVAAIALYRPGPMDSIPDYCRRKKGMQKVDYFDKSIEPYVKKYLKDTYGILVFQEQVMQICNSLAGFTVNDGYVMIKAVGKKKKELLESFKDTFVKGCSSKNIDVKLASKYWDDFIVPFSSYGFNRSHSAAYGFTSYICGYLKANYPDEFMCSRLNVAKDKDQDKVKVYLKECKRMGIQILPKDINECETDYAIVKKQDKLAGVMQSQIRPSLVCDNLGLAAAQEVAKNAPYKGIKDFAMRTDSKIVDAKVLGALIDAGFLNKKIKENKGAAIKLFGDVRIDLKKAAKKGITIENLFEDL